jgi:nitrate reductase assembly molybdenum cofactor insertion protein NarJ
MKNMEKRGKKIFSLLAALMESPTIRFIDQVSDSIRHLELVSWEARQHLVAFREFCLANTLAGLQTLYRRTFGSGAACCPYVGNYLFGHGRSRLLFAAKLREEYLAHVVSHKKEIPDHIAVMLRSLVVQDSVEEARELISCCLIPASVQMTAILKHDDNPYQEVLRAVLLTLQAEERNAGARPEQYAFTH